MIQKTARTHRGHLAFLVGQVHPRDVPCRAFEHVRVFERENAVPDVPSLDFVSFTSGTDVSTESRTKEIVAPFETSKDFLLLLKLLLCGLTTDCFACFRKEARVVVEARRPTREDKVDIFFYPREERLVVFLSVWMRRNC